METSKDRVGMVGRPGLDGRPAMALAVVLGLGLAIRALAVLEPPCLPGPDGAYYLVQVRGILRGDGLPVPDLPLLFYALAGVAWVLARFQETAPAIVSAVTWSDTLLPLALALPVYAIARDTQPHRAGLATLLAGVLAVASGNVLEMAAGMIKNGAALPLSLGYVYWVVRTERSQSAAALSIALVLLFASCLTHVSALAVGIAFTVPWMYLRLNWRGAWLVLALVAGLAAGLTALAWIDPARGHRVLEACLRPWSAFSPDWGAAAIQPAVWLGNALGLLGLTLYGMRRASWEPWAGDLLAAASLAALILSCPLLRPEWLERLALVALVPGLVVAVFVAGARPAGPALLAPLLVVSLAHGFLAAKTLRVTGLTQQASDELEALRDVLPAGPRIVLVRPHLRWWAAWTLDSKFSTSVAGVLADRESYGTVLVLDEVRPGAFGLAPYRPSATPGSALRDGALLGSESFDVLREGAFFRLARLGPAQASAGP